MALQFYTEANPDKALSVNGAFTNPLAITFDGVNGGVIEKRLYLRNDSELYQYTGIEISCENGTGKPIVDGTDGYSWKLFAGDQRPLEEQWGMVAPGNAISLASLSDTTTYLPFWVRIEVPAGAPVESFQSAYFGIDATETAI